jgi:hypothetical protein
VAFGTASKIFTAFVEDVIEQRALFDMDTHTFKVALYGNGGTPDQTAASANTAYNAGAWATANEIYDAAEWAQTGQALDSVTSAFTTNVYKFDAADEVSAGTSATLTAVYGCLIFDDSLTTPVADQGVSYHYFGGSQSVTDGTFTVVFNGSGIFTLTL